MDELLRKLKVRLGITWTDENTNEGLSDSLESAIQYLDEIAGVHLDYLTDAQARSLLFDRVRYERSNALDEFEINYFRELEKFRVRYCDYD